MASSSIVWMCVKKHNSFRRVAENGQQFSGEPGNLRNLNTRRYNGFQNRAIDISGDAKNMTIATKSVKNANKPAKVMTTVKLGRFTRRSNNTIKAIAKQSGRADLTNLALARASAAAQVKGGRVAKRRRLRNKSKKLAAKRMAAKLAAKK
eukprot:TRINITY_DN63730_c0_g1_i1.p1 TRINITY_DN63730_c0_g1~~TRINITY_DN63730_c0_g1_i1.p1  ORF type:complete len:150 (+),score=36.05 TRINITY_DN63730_c0_g1_i1:2-451(+)